MLRRWANHLKEYFHEDHEKELAEGQRIWEEILAEKAVARANALTAQREATAQEKSDAYTSGPDLSTTPKPQTQDQKTESKTRPPVNPPVSQPSPLRDSNIAQNTALYMATGIFYGGW